MSVDFYLAGKKHHRLFDIGNHKSPFRIWIVLSEAIADPSLRTAERFVEALVLLLRATEAEGLFIEETDTAADLEPYARQVSPEIVSFCEEEGWDVTVVNDGDDTLHAARTDGKLWPVTHRIGMDSVSCLICKDCGMDAGTIDGRCRDCDIDHLFAQMKCPDCGNTIAREDIEIPEIAALVLELGWVHKDDCPRRHS
jgi:hypothetical protein